MGYLYGIGESDALSLLPETYVDKTKVSYDQSGLVEMQGVRAFSVGV